MENLTAVECTSGIANIMAIIGKVILLHVGNYSILYCFHNINYNEQDLTK